MLAPVGIALGSNLGDCSAELDAGMTFLRSLSIDGKIRESPRLETEPVDCSPGSPAFLNAVAEIRIATDALPPRALLERLQAFERERGRPAEHGVNAPRPLDLDLIYYACVVAREPDLVVPHPRAHLRRFVLEPLSHLRPDLVLAGQTKTVAELLAGLTK